jgi:hypothetical protein
MAEVVRIKTEWSVDVLGWVSTVTNCFAEVVYRTEGKYSREEAKMDAESWLRKNQKEVKTDG